MGRLLALLALLLLLPMAAAQAPTQPGIYNPGTSTPATMYFHINGFQQFPINTQMPDDRYAVAAGRGLADNSGCFDAGDTQTFTKRSVHTWYGYSSPSIVEYDVFVNGGPKIHPERGISYDVELDPGVTPMFTWFLEASWPEQDAMPSAPPVPPPTPEVIVRATVREGDAISVGHTALNEGQIIAQGESDKATLFGDVADDGSQHVTVHDLGGGRIVYEFTFPLDYGKTTIDRDESYNVRVDAFIENPVPDCDGPGSAEGGDYLMLDHVLVHSSAAFRPRLEWSVMNPLYIEALHPQFVGDDLAVHTASNSPWGSYDVFGDLLHEQPGMELSITGKTEALSLERIEIKEHTTGHHRHQEAVSAVWLWDYRQDQAQPGVYEVVLRIRNDQGNAEAWALATFEIGHGGAQVCAKNIGDEDVVCTRGTPQNAGKDAPALAPMAGLALLVALASRRR